jgi:hypothetical protein
MPRDLPRNPLLIQVLSLYLLLLAFFVLLNNVSSVETARSKAVAGSLQSTFATEGRPTMAPAVFTSILGNAIADAALEERVGELVRTEIGIAEFHVIVPGRVMEIVLGERDLFRGPGIAIDPRHRGFVEELARIVATPPPGVRYDVDLLIAGGLLQEMEPGAPLDEPAARSAFLADVLTDAGAPAASVAAGVETGDPGQVRLKFHVRPAVEPALFAGEAALP